MSIQRLLKELLKEVEDLERLLDNNAFKYYTYFYGKYRYGGKVWEYATFFDDTSDVDTAVKLIKHAFKCVRGVRRRLILSKLPCTVGISEISDSLEINCGDNTLSLKDFPAVTLVSNNIIMIYPKGYIHGKDVEVIIIATPEHVGISVNGLWRIDSSTNLIYYDFISWTLRDLMEIADRVKVEESKFGKYLNNDVIDLDGVS